MAKRPGKTRVVTVNDAAFTAIAASVHCNQITFGEDPSVASWPTTDFLIKKPDTSATAIRRVRGTSYRVEGPFTPGDIAAYVQTVTGSTSFFIDEDNLLGDPEWSTVSPLSA